MSTRLIIFCDLSRNQTSEFTSIYSDPNAIS